MSERAHMPILRMITQQHPRRGEMASLEPETAQFLAEIQNCAKFDIQIAADIQKDQAMRAKDQTVVIDDGAGQIKAPYPDMWIEWSRGDYSVGCLLVERTPGYDNTALDNAHSDQLLTFFLLKGRVIDPMIQGDLSRLDFQIGVKLNESNGFGGWVVVGEPLKPEIDAMAQTWLGICVTALALINCRNVTTEESGRITFRRSGSQKRRGDPAKLIRYRTIVLPGHEGASTRGRNTGVTALHKVRGHFKTYTAERPLLGKSTGTYWWGWQVRGSKKNGTVVSDYKVGVS